MARRAAIITALRTPIGRYAGALSPVRPDDLAALVIRAAVERSGVEPDSIDDVYMGAANQSGEDNRDVARMAALLAGLPESVPGVTVNRLCASGLESVILAARLIESGHGDIFVAGGVESMSRAPYVLSKSETPFGRAQEIHDTSIGWRFVNPRMIEMGHTDALGVTAENIAREHNITREDQDRFALGSQHKWAAAHNQGLFDDELIRVEVPGRRGDPVIVDTDEHPRPDTTMDALRALRPAFVKDESGTVTAGNASGVNDGAAALVLVEESRAKALGLTPIAFVDASASAGVAPSTMGIGPVPATRKALARARLSLADIGRIELNEAFAAQSIACVRELDIDESRLNTMGGAIAIGHPLGCTGARLVTTLVHQMRRSGIELGLATLCVGVGQGLAAVFRAP